MPSKLGTPFLHLDTKKAAKSFLKLNRYIVIFILCSSVISSYYFCNLFCFLQFHLLKTKKAALFNITLIRDIRQNGF